MKHLVIHNPIFNESLAEFEKYLKQEGYSNSSQSSLPSAVKELLFWMEQNHMKDLDLINQQLVDDYFNYLKYRPNNRRNGGVGYKHLNKCAQAIIRYAEFHFGVERGRSGIIKSFKIRKHAQRIVLTQQEVRMLFEAQEDNVYGYTTKAILACLYGLGLRVLELYRLDESDINFTKKEVFVKESKTGASRTVPMNYYIAQTLQTYMFRKRALMVPMGKKESAVIISSQGNRMATETIRFRVKQAVKEAGITKNINPHDLRRSLGTHLIQNGLSSKDVAFMLGHKTIDSLVHYIHLSKLNKK